MNSWNSEFVNSLYEKQSLGYITVIGGEAQLHSQSVAEEYRRIVETESTTSHDASALARACAEAAKQPASLFPFHKPSLGYVVQWLAELGKEAELNGLLQYAGNCLRPTWEKGGLFYPRNDVQSEKEADAHMDP